MEPTIARQARAVLSGRETECARLDRLLAGAHEGQSAVLVLRGESGIGKSALLNYAVEHAEGCRVLRAMGVEWELELPFAGLHQLCVGLLERRARLPTPQAQALATAFGLSSGPQPDRFLVGLAVLSLLSDAAAEHPLVCLVMTSSGLIDPRPRCSRSWLGGWRPSLSSSCSQSASPAELEELAGLPDLRVGRLADRSARELLATVITAPMDERVRARILAETRGNPLALHRAAARIFRKRTGRRFWGSGRRIAAAPD